MRILSAVALLSLAACAGSADCCCPCPCESHGAAQADGWIDLLPGKDLKGWKRLPLDPQLAAKAVWKMSDDGKVLLIDGTDSVKEMLLCEREFGDGVLHVEWRWRKHTDPKQAYNGGVYLRTSADGKSWVQAQVAAGEKPPFVGDLIAMPPGATQRTDFLQKGPSPMNPIGEWNHYDVTCRGKSIELSVNGKATVAWDDCPLPRGLVGMQAEFAFIEVRAFRFKPL